MHAANGGRNPTGCSSNFSHRATRASARSMPAVTLAEVAMFPSLMKIGSGSTSTAGYWSRRAPHCDQWVVARLPSSRPALASRNAPVQTEATRFAWCVRADPADEVRVLAARARAARNDQQVGRIGPGLVAEVAIRGDAQAARRADLGTAEAGGADPVGPLAVVVPGAAKTSSGPVTSRDCTLSNKTMSTVRTRPSLASPAHGSNDENPTNPAIHARLPRPRLANRERLVDIDYSVLNNQVCKQAAWPRRKETPR